MSKMTQEEFIAILFTDNGYNTAAQRKGWLQLRFQVNFPDELTIAQKSRAIEMLKAEKAGVPVDEDDDHDW